ncbi:MAG: nitrate/sulfonate/bicarbonate ABC transporter ATP-binding protein [Anaerolineae bacterium]|nr:nitrate/sulfonate/bicarbonate ABC transporter ATP-binding protein [Anaerolineae bacterium]
MDEREVLVELRDVTKTYGREPRVFVAIERVNMRIQEGEFVCMLGPSGSGKSTLLRIIAGLTPPSSGEVLYRGRRLIGVNPYATIVFQSFALFPWLTVQQNVEVGLQARGVDPAERQRRALELIDVVGLDGFESAYPRELSGGMRQKVGFARAMAVEPELLLLDEPFSALDVLSAEALRGELVELWLSHRVPIRAILMVTHSIEEAVLMADRIVVMDKDPGRVVDEVGVPMPYPRHRKDRAYQAMVDRIYAVVAGETEAPAEALGTAPGVPGPTVALPEANMNAVAGLTEELREAGSREDLPRLAERLNLELDDLLPVVDAAEILSLARVRRGDIILTPLGETFAEASILARKEIAAARILRIPTIRWVYETLQADPDGRLPADYFLDRLRTDFGEYAEEQLAIAIGWGRYAELFSFDDATDELFVEAPAPVARQ